MRPDDCADQTTVWHAGHLCGCCRVCALTAPSFDIKVVAAHGSVIYSPCFHFTRNAPLAKWTTIDKLPGGNVSVLDTKAIPACTAVIYVPCAHGASHGCLTHRADISESFLAGLLSSQLYCIFGWTSHLVSSLCPRPFLLCVPIVSDRLVLCTLCCWLFRRCSRRRCAGRGLCLCRLSLLLRLCFHLLRTVSDLFPDKGYDLLSLFLRYLRLPCSRTAYRLSNHASSQPESEHNGIRAGIRAISGGSAAPGRSPYYIYICTDIWELI